MWRTVSFVERIEVDFCGNLFNEAIFVGDVDNDKAYELVVGNVEGDLAVFKGTCSSPWRKSSDLGMITCVGVGDIESKGKNMLVVLTAEGWCYIYDIKSDHSGGSDQNSKEGEDSDKTLKPLFTQHLPANGKVLLIADVDGDGQTELVIGYADRVVRCFKWMSISDGEPELISNAKLIQCDKWQLSRQIGSLTLNIAADGMPELLVAQPGGTYSRLFHTVSTDDGTQEEISFEEVPLSSARSRNVGIKTEIVGGIVKDHTKDMKRTMENQDSCSKVESQNVDKKDIGTYCALCTLDGTLVMVENKQVLWSLQVDHQLFSLTKLDVTGNGTDEVICCAWDGQTYIVNHSRDVVRYQFDENVAAFTAGLYAVNGQDNVPCFVYATFNNKIYIYYNISLPQVESTNLIEVMDKMEETKSLLNKLELNNISVQQKRELYHWCLYGWKPKT